MTQHAIERLYALLQIFERHQLLMFTRRVRDMVLTNDMTSQWSARERCEFVWFITDIEDLLNALYYCQALIRSYNGRDKIEAGTVEQKFHLVNIAIFLETHEYDLHTYLSQEVKPKTDIIIRCEEGSPIDLTYTETKLFITTLWYLFELAFTLGEAMPVSEYEKAKLEEAENKKTAGTALH